MNYCRECGKILDREQNECPYCGTKIDEIIDQEKEDMNLAELRPDENKESTDYFKEEQDKEIELLDENSRVGEVQNSPVNQPDKSPLNNWIKVTLSVLISILPGLGPLVGIIISIIFMTSEDEDRKTFGYAILTYSVVFLILLCACCMILTLMAPMGALRE